MNKGQSIVEIMLVFGLLVTILPALVVGFMMSRSGKAQHNQRLQAVALLKETEEAVRSVRESGWSAFAANGTFHPIIVGSSWLLASGTDVIDGFTRSVDIEEVERSSAGDIVASGGTVDPSTKKVTATISWGTPFPSSVRSDFYLARFDNLLYTQTTEADFNAGIKNAVAVTNTNGGEIVLGAGGGGNWCEPNLSIAALDLPKQGVANAITAIEGRIFAGTGDNSSGESFVNINVNNSHPPVATILGTFDGYKTNDVFGEPNYGYIATDTNSKEIIIIDISTTPYSEVGSFDAPGSTDANSIFVLGNIGYMTQGNRFRNFDLSAKTASRPAIDSDGIALTGGGTGRSIYIVGNYAYVTTNANTIVVIDLQNPSNLQFKMLMFMGGENAHDIVVNSTGTRGYIAKAKSATEREFRIVEIDLAGESFTTLGQYDTNDMDPKELILVPGNRAIIVGSGGQEYQVIDISDETNPVGCGGLSIDTGINGIASVLETDGDAYSYIITGDANEELKIIEGGPGGYFATAGTFESSIFDAGYETAFNRLSFTAVKPAQTDIILQVAAADAVSGHCSGASFAYVGPDGGPGTFFTIPDAIPLDNDGMVYENPGRCFRYKAYLSTSDTFASPVLEEVTVNYSP